jgi:hypothetical protein
MDERMVLLRVEGENKLYLDLDTGEEVWSTGDA